MLWPDSNHTNKSILEREQKTAQEKESDILNSLCLSELGDRGAALPSKTQRGVFPVLILVLWEWDD